jgi:sialate O-acetylesterase
MVDSFKKYQAACLLSALLSISAFAGTGLELHPLFSDHAVLQRDRPLPVTGWAAPNAEVRVAFAGQERSTHADASGTWTAILDPIPVTTTPGRLRVMSGDELLEVNDLLVGDVWIGSGQSNMGGSPSRADIEGVDDPLLRVVNIGMTRWLAPLDRPKIGNPWRPASGDKLKGFSNVMFHFSRSLRQEEPGVPVGVIVSCVGGTGIDHWFPLRDKESDSLLKGLSANRLAALQRYRDNFPALVGQYPETAALQPWLANEASPREPFPSIDDKHLPKAAAGLFHGMIAPLRSFPVAGVVWYQGEANAGELETYATKLTMLIERWRDAWRNPAMPFLIVQLPNFTSLKEENPGKEPGFAPCREAQRRVSATLPNVLLSVNIDIGTSFDIHPPDKKVFGERLGRTWLSHRQGDTSGHSPRPVSWETDGEAVTVHFAPAGVSLVTGRVTGRGPFEALPLPDLKLVEILDATGEWHPATVELSGDTLTATVPGIAASGVRYAWRADPKGPLLYSSNGLPATPFLLKRNGGD